MEDWDDNERFDAENGDDGDGSSADIGKKFSIIVLDGRENMSLNTDESSGKTYLNEVFEAVATYLRRMAVTGDTAKIAVFIAGVDDVHEPKLRKAFRNRILQLNELKAPNTEVIKKLQAYASDAAAYKRDFTCGAVGSNSSIDEAITMAQMALLNAKARPIDDRSISFFTNDDAPPDAAAARSKARDVSQDRIELRVYARLHPTKGFEASKFWSDLVRKDQNADAGEEDDEAGMPIETYKSFEDVVDGMRRREYRKRVSRKLLMTLADGLHISVGVYHNLHTAHKPTARKATYHSGVIVPVRPVSRFIESSTGDVIDAADATKGLVVSGGIALVSSKEAKQLTRIQSTAGAGASSSGDRFHEASSSSNSGGSAAAYSTAYPTGLRILGFQPRRLLRETDNVAPGNLIYPYDWDVEGSRSAFRALWRRLLERDLVAIVTYVAREQEPPVVWALLPERERVDDHGMQSWPPCLYAITLPFADDYRRIPASEQVTNEKPTPALLAATHALVQDFTVKYPGTWDLHQSQLMNPSLQQFYHGLEAVALGARAPVDALSNSAFEALRNASDAPALEHYCSILRESTGYSEGAKAGSKRKAEGPIDTSDLNESALVHAGHLRKQTVELLKAICRKRGLAVGGAKEALCQRIESDVAKKG